MLIPHYCIPDVRCSAVIPQKKLFDNSESLCYLGVVRTKTLLAKEVINMSGIIIVIQLKMLLASERGVLISR